MSALVHSIAAGILLLAWAALAFWTFSYAFSSSFFRWNLPARRSPRRSSSGSRS